MTVETIIQPALWGITAIAVATIAILLVRRRRRSLPLGRLPHALAGLAVLAIVVIPSVAWVPAGYRGVVYRWGGGVDPSERGEGLTFVAPWVETVRLVSVRTRKVASDKIFAQSADLQEITVVGSVNYRIDSERAAELYQRVGPRYEEVVIEPAMMQRTKAAVGEVRAEDFALARGRLAAQVREQLARQLVGYGILVEYYNIEDAIFDPDFVTAVKEKVIAEQEAARQRNLIAAKRAEKEQRIIEAQATARATLIEATAQAKANRRVAASLTPGMIRWQWLTKWDGTLPSTLVVSDQGAGLLIQPPASMGGYGY